MKNEHTLMPAHGGYRKLKSFQVAQLVYDVTVRFCARYIDKRSRTHDQMVQAARSGVQNIAEGSVASGTSKKTELKLTNVARASLEELKLDYEDYLRQRGWERWPPLHPALKRFKALRCSSVDDLKARVVAERKRAKESARTETSRTEVIQTDTDAHGRTRVSDRRVYVGEGSCRSVPSSAQLAANGALSLLNLCCYFLDKQLATLEKQFLEEGGFTERLYRARIQSRRK